MHVNSQFEEELIGAACYGLMPSLARLFQIDVNVNVLDVHGNTPLIWAAHFGHIDVCNELISHGANINAENNYGETALIRASMHGHGDIAKILIIAGANIDIKDNKGLTALMWGEKNKKEAIIAIFNNYSSVSNTNTTEKLRIQREFFGAIKHKNLIKLSRMLDMGANPNIRNQLLETALFKAVYYGHMEVAELLIKAGANINKQSNGKTPLELAKQKNDTEIIVFLSNHNGWGIIAK